jgi:large-conductance mechanosensitive channel
MDWIVLNSSSKDFFHFKFIDNNLLLYEYDKELEDYKIKCFGITFGVGKFITALIKFIIISYVIFIFISISNKYIN